MPYVSKAKLQELLAAGGAMANAFYNMKQFVEKSDAQRASYAEWQERWDAARAALKKPERAS